jgi:hypothetical protein
MGLETVRGREQWKLNSLLGPKDNPAVLMGLKEGGCIGLRNGGGGGLKSTKVPVLYILVQ